jgi:hypothetical protein
MHWASGGLENCEGRFELGGRCVPFIVKQVLCDTQHVPLQLHTELLHMKQICSLQRMGSYILWVPWYQHALRPNLSGYWCLRTQQRKARDRRMCCSSCHMSAVTHTLCSLPYLERCGKLQFHGRKVGAAAHQASCFAAARSSQPRGMPAFARSIFLGATTQQTRSSYMHPFFCRGPCAARGLALNK